MATPTNSGTLGDLLTLSAALAANEADFEQPFRGRKAVPVPAESLPSLDPEPSAEAALNA